MVKSPEQAKAAGAERIPLQLFEFEPDPVDEGDRDFKDFIESISLSPEELEAFLTAPELSTPEEAKRLVSSRSRMRI